MTSNSEAKADQVTSDQEVLINKVDDNVQMPSFEPQKCSWQVYVQVFKNKVEIADIEDSKWQQHLLANVGF